MFIYAVFPFLVEREQWGNNRGVYCYLSLLVKTDFFFPAQIQFKTVHPLNYLHLDMQAYALHASVSLFKHMTVLWFNPF